MTCEHHVLRTMKAAIAILLFVIVSACVINSEVIGRAKVVEPGASKDHILDILGPPGDTQSMGLNEAWQYCSTDLGFRGYDEYVVIWFHDGIVTGISMYKNSEEGMCGEFFRPIDWASAPHIGYTQTQGRVSEGQQILDVLIEGIDDGVKTTNQQDRNEALMDAKLQAIERAGVSITSVSTMEDFVLKEEWIESKSKGILMPGFQVIDKGYQDNGVYLVILSGKIRFVGSARE